MIIVTNSHTRLQVAMAVVNMQEPGLPTNELEVKARAGAYTTIRNRKPIVAYVNLGRWVADCPCNGAEIVEPGEDMLCGSCSMVSTVVFPDSETKIKIESVLLQREPFHQNWHPDETVDELVAQNIENGLFPDDLKEG